MAGWIRLYRQLLKSSTFQNEKLFKVFIWCLLKATHTEHEQLVGRQIVKLQPGQFVFGRFKAAEELGMKESTLRDLVQMLKQVESIDIKSTNKYSVITVVNWDLYQSEEENPDIRPTAKNRKNTKQIHKNGDFPDSRYDSRYSSESFGGSDLFQSEHDSPDSKHDNRYDNKSTTNGQQSDTNKNVKNDKKGIYATSQFKPPTVEEVGQYCTERQNGVDASKWHDFYSSKGWMVGKNKMKDWKAAVRTWERNNKPPDKPPDKKILW